RRGVSGRHLQVRERRGDCHSRKAANRRLEIRVRQGLAGLLSGQLSRPEDRPPATNWSGHIQPAALGFAFSHESRHAAIRAKPNVEFQFLVPFSVLWLVYVYAYEELHLAVRLSLLRRWNHRVRGQYRKSKRIIRFIEFRRQHLQRE